MTPVCIGPVDDDVPEIVDAPDPEDPAVAVAVGAVELTPMQTARVSFWVRLANRPVSQLDPTQGFQFVRSVTLMEQSEAMSEYRTSGTGVNNALSTTARIVARRVRNLQPFSVPEMVVKHEHDAVVPL